jgi:hypothetical protein
MIIRIMCGFRPTDSCRNTFKVLRILSLQSQYIFSLLLFVVDHKDLYQTTSQIHRINTRCKLDFYYPQSSLAIHQKGPDNFGIRLFNHLPLYIKELVHDNKQFRKALSVFLHPKSFYTIEEYFNHV